MNFDVIRTFEGGWKTDLKDNIERKNTAQKIINSRLYASNGVFSISAVSGGRVIYQNQRIVKYLGFSEFDDELIVFAKCLKPEDLDSTEEEVCVTSLLTSPFQIVVSPSYNTPINIDSELTDNSSEQENCYTETIPAINPLDFEINFACDDAAGEEVDFGEYYNENIFVPNFALCSSNENEVPRNNVDYLDCIYSLKEGEDSNLVGTLLWVGMQNWAIDGKITTENNTENQFYKRVYYTDSLNYRRVVNIKDANLIYRSGNDFNQILNNILLQPEIKEVTGGGQLPAMRSLYFYRIISENGQVSEFSPSSYFVDIIYEDEPIEYRGGDISEITDRSVIIKCNILNAQASSEIECVAVEYEAFGAPTAIRNLGKRSVNSIVEFQHFGNEEEFADSVTIQDIIDFKNTWKYCNDFTSKKNKLIAAGLRNDPIPTEINNLEYLFPLHSWNTEGNTYDCIMNPKPWIYKYIDPSNTDSLIFIKQKVYRLISSFGNLIITFKNKITNEEISLEINELPVDLYSNITLTIINWLSSEKTNNPDFVNFFPNLNIINSNGQMLFYPTDENTQTDMSNYILESNNNQFIQNFDNDIVFLDVDVDENNLVNGAQSIGFNEGTGIRVTYREFKEPLLNQAQGIYDGTGKILDFEKPSGSKFFMKGEIYRLAFQAYNNDSTRYFSIPLGDLMIPSLGELKTEIDDAGNSIITSQKYVNQSVENGILYGHGIKMKIEVRLSCELQKNIPMYKILYVERDEENRTILCQGISAPLIRVQHNGSGSVPMKEAFKNKWILPYYGGPTYGLRGLLAYDAFTENDQYTGEEAFRRTMTNRSLMYFDSPDLYYNKISSQFLSNSKIDIVGKLNTDHTQNLIRQRGGDYSAFGFGGFETVNFGNEIYPKFSRKILERQLEGNNNSENLPGPAEEDRKSGTFEGHFINVSVFSEFQSYNDQKEIKNSEELLRGEILSGAAFDLDNDISNNTLCLPSQPWFYGNFQRSFSLASNDGMKSTILRSGVTSPGYKTNIIKTTEDLFTEDFIGPTRHTVYSEIRNGGGGYVVYDTIPLINIFRDNRESVYGGRTKEAYSRNTYISLTKTIPTLKSSNGIQSFIADGDTYVTLNIRTKNDYGDDDLIQDEMNNDNSGRARGDIKAWYRNGGWVYVVVLESQVEPKYTSQYEFYRRSITHGFDKVRPELINEAYFNITGLKSYIPKPFNFRDDPNRGNVIAVSDVKLAGEYFDSWTSFKPNNFYPALEKNKGDISNIIKEKDNIYAIQKNQTSLILIGTDRIVSDSQGNPINIKQGAGTVVDGHQIISSFGTAIRRAVNENFDYGFCFFDETKNEFIKINKPLFVQNLLHLNILERFKNNPVIDTECYFNDEHKETNIRVRTKNGTNILFSYNEILSIFNGEREFDNDVYMPFKNKIYSPLRTNTNEEPLSQDLEVLNEGDPLFFFGEQKTMIIGFYLNANIDKVFQYKQWNAICNIDYPFKSITLKSNLGYERIILGDHVAYKIREGNHSVPGINESNVLEEYADVRGNWVYVEMEIESINKKRVDVLSIVNSLRISHQ